MNETLYNELMEKVVRLRELAYASGESGSEDLEEAEEAAYKELLDTMRQLAS